MGERCRQRGRRISGEGRVLREGRRTDWIMCRDIVRCVGWRDEVVMGEKLKPLTMGNLMPSPNCLVLCSSGIYDGSSLPSSYLVGTRPATITRLSHLSL